MGPDGLVFPLPPRRRSAGTLSGRLPAVERGPGLDLVGLRPYRPGDDARRVDARASARVSTLTQTDTLLVREHQADRAPRVVVAIDRSASMALFPGGFPWLSKPAAVAAATRAIAASASAVGARLELLDELPLGESLTALELRRRPLPPGSFLFLVSDYLGVVDERALERALARRLDVVPVVVQDAVWERSFPDVAGVLLPVAGPEAGAPSRAVRLTAGEVRTARTRNEARLERLLGAFERLGLDWVLLPAGDDNAVSEAFRGWAERRTSGGRLR